MTLQSEEDFSLEILFPSNSFRNLFWINIEIVLNIFFLFMIFQKRYSAG